MPNEQQRVRRPDKEDGGRRRPLSFSPQLPPVNTTGNYNCRPATRLWEDSSLPEDIKAELLPELKAIVEEVLNNNCLQQLLSYVAIWHPRLPPHVFAAHSGHRSRRGFLLPANDLAEIIWSIGAQMEVLRLLSDRGPDFGLSLLLLLELCLQVAFCLRKPANNARGNTLEARRNYSAIITNCPKIMELLSLHLDCPPLRPRFIKKYALTCLGFLYHRKFPSASLTRFFQVHFFINPSARKHVFEKVPSNVDRAYFLPKVAAEAVEEYLWEKARELSLGGPVENPLRLTADQTEIPVDSQRAAMAVVFERLNHLARGLFGTSLCLYGSAASGFATCQSDVDVVLQLGRSGVETMLEDLRRVRAEGGLDINPFPSKTQTGYTRACENWAWTTERPHATVATIWAGRKLAWACHRLYGWDAFCVQHAYVPIVRILAAVDPTGRPQAVPPIFRPQDSWEASFPLALQIATRREQSTGLLLAPDVNESLQTLCSSPDGRSDAVLILLKTVAHSIICEKLYACWGGQSTDQRLTEAALCFYPATREVKSQDLLKLPETQCLLECISNYAKATPDPYDDLMSGPGLPPTTPSPLDDGRLSPEFNGESSRTLWLVDADCSMDRSVGIHNSRLLRAYASCDPRVVALTLLVKHWARCNGLGDAYSGYLSGYQWTLMVIHYLQHYLCIPLPPKFANEAFVRDLELPGRRQSKKTMVPLVPNLQRDPPIEGFQKMPVTVHEPEGIADVFFYQPTLGANRPLPLNLQEACRGLPTPDSSPPASPRRSEHYKPWPEDQLLRSDPLAYAFTLLTCPFHLNADSLAQPQPDELWKCRIATCPRPPRASRPSKQCFQQWEKARAEVKAQLTSSTGKNGRLAAAPFPNLDTLRDDLFINDHVMTRKSLQLPFHNALTLTELLYGFFEYYGMRFNFATDISDIDRIPELPAAKKEFFETSVFKPAMKGGRNFPATAHETGTDSSRPSLGCREVGWGNETAGDASSVEGTSVEDKGDEITLDGEGTVPASESDQVEQSDAVPQKEVIGRGKGAYQYRGRHFICIRDPFEKERTIGPPFYCQSHISTEMLSALQLFGWLRCKEEEEPGSAKTLMTSLFNSRGGHTYGHIYHPFKEALKESITSITEEGELADQMYGNIADIICSHGNYNGLFDQQRRSNMPSESRPQTQSQPPPAVRRVSHGSDLPPPPGFQNDMPPRKSSLGLVSSSASTLPKVYDPTAAVVLPLVANPSGMSSPAPVPIVESMIRTCRHFSLNFGNIESLTVYPNDMKRFRGTDYPDALGWLRSRTDILCECSVGQNGVAPMELERYDRLAASCEKSIPFPGQAWPPKAPPAARKPEETFLLNLINGKTTDMSTLDLGLRPAPLPADWETNKPFSSVAQPGTLSVDAAKRVGRHQTDKESWGGGGEQRRQQHRKSGGGEDGGGPPPPPGFKGSVGGGSGGGSRSRGDSRGGGSSQRKVREPWFQNGGGEENPAPPSTAGGSATPGDEGRQRGNRRRNGPRAWQEDNQNNNPATVSSQDRRRGKRKGRGNGGGNTAAAPTP